MYYQFAIEQPWRDAPVPNVSQHLAERANRRYGLTAPDADDDADVANDAINAGAPKAVGEAWALLAESSYSEPISDLDPSGVKYFPAWQMQFEDDRYTPTAKLCKVFGAWEKLVSVAESGAIRDAPSVVTVDGHHATVGTATSTVAAAASAPFRYDLVNLGREILAQLSSPVSLNFSDATKAKQLNAQDLNRTGQFYAEILQDMDTLVATDPAFLLGPWLVSARAKAAEGADDCPADGFPSVGTDCADFYEWNARVQLTTWKPTPANASEVVSEADGHTLNSKETDGEVDYAGKHWSGLLRDYYAPRARLVLEQALADAGAARPFNWKPLNRKLAELAYNWTTSHEKYPTTPQGDATEVSRAMLGKYGRHYAACEPQ